MKFFQLVLWSDCNNHCQFCKQPKQTNLNKQNILSLTSSCIKNSILEKDSRLLLVGGELFLEEVQEECYLPVLKALLSNDNIIELQILTNLLHKKLESISSIYNTFRTLQSSKQFIVGTSYDEKGRFSTELSRKQWIRNVRILTTSFPDLNVSVNVILTKFAIQRGLKDIYNELKNYGVTNVNFIPPLCLDKEWLPKQEDVVRQLLEFDYSFRKQMMSTYDTSVEKVLLQPNESLTDWTDVTAKLNSCGHPVNFQKSYTDSCWACEMNKILL